MAFVVTNIRKKGEPWGDSDDLNVTYYIDAKSDEDGAVQEDVPAYVSASTILEVGAKGDLKRSKKGKLYFKPGESNGKGDFKKAQGKLAPSNDQQTSIERQGAIRTAAILHQGSGSTTALLETAQVAYAFITGLDPVTTQGEPAEVAVADTEIRVGGGGNSGVEDDIPFA